MPINADECRNVETHAPAKPPMPPAKMAESRARSGSGRTGGGLYDEVADEFDMHVARAAS